MIILRDKKKDTVVLVKELLEVFDGASASYKISITRNNVEVITYKAGYETFKEIVSKILGIQGVRGVLIQSELITSVEQVQPREG